MTKRRIFLFILIVVNILFICGFVAWLLNRNYPIIGHDYRLFMPYMLDSYLHQRINGLTVQWYTPSFAGGRPVFPNPQDLQFSLPQFLLWLVPPWAAIQLSIFVFIAAGFVASAYFLRKILGLSAFAAILGAVFFSANGFYFEHMAAGHVTFQVFPLFALIIVILTHPRLSWWLGGVLLSLVLTVILYTGIHNVPLFILASLIFFPSLYLIKPSLLDWKRLFSMAAWGGFLTVLICGSRISAVISFMRFFPRLVQDNYSTTFLTGAEGIVRQLLGTMNLTPLYRLLYLANHRIFPAQSVVDMAVSTGTPYGYWELDASLSPVLVFLLFGGAIRFIWRRPVGLFSNDKKRWIAIGCLALAIWLTIEFTLAKGLLYPQIRDWPILASLRANVRNVAAFIFPLAVIGSVIYDRWTKNWKSAKKGLVVFLLLNGTALGALLSYYWIPTVYAVVAKYSLNQADYRPIQDTYEKIRYEGEIFPVERIIPGAAPWTVFEENASSTIDPYNTYFKVLGSDIINLHAGPVEDVSGGRFNIINPTGYVFPEVNGSSMGERISTVDSANFLDFIHRRQPKWKLPLYQEILDWTSLLSLGGGLLFLILYGLNRRVRLIDRKDWYRKSRQRT